MKKFVNDTLSVGVSKILIILFGLGSSVVISRVLGPEGSGQIAALLVYPSIFMSIGSLGIRQSTTYLLGKSLYSEEQIKNGIVKIWLITSIFSCVSCFILLKYVSEQGDNTMLVLLALLPIPFSLFNTYGSGIFLAKNQIKSFNRINWIPVLITFVCTCLLVALMPFGINGALTAKFLGVAVLFFIYFYRNEFSKYFNWNYDWSVIKKLISLGGLYAISLLIISLNYKADQILLDKLSTDYELGIYTRGVTIIEYLWQIPMLFSTIVFARSSISKNNRDFSLKVAQLLRFSLVLVGLASLILYVLSHWIIITLYGVEFESSILILRTLLPGVVILTFYKVMNMDLAGRGKPWVAMYTMLPCLILNLGLNLYLIPDYGAFGAALSSMISYSLAGLIFLISYSRNVGIGIKEMLVFNKADYDLVMSLGSFRKLKNESQE